MAYLNLDLDYFDHPKVGRLIGQLGRGADMLPVRLWCYCGKYHADTGELIGYSPLEIETAIKWWGQPGRAAEILVSLGFLERCENGFKVHDWDKINGHIGAFRARAQAGAKARWEKARADAQAMLKHSPSNAASNALQEDSKASESFPSGELNSARVDARHPQPPAGLPPVSQAHHDRARAVCEIYPIRSLRDGRAIRKDLLSMNRLASKIAAHPEFDWEDAARLEGLSDSPQDLGNWVAVQPDALLLETRRKQEQTPTPLKPGERPRKTLRNLV